jgi:hypothetical protein
MYLILLFLVFLFLNVARRRNKIGHQCCPLDGGCRKQNWHRRPLHPVSFLRQKEAAEQRESHSNVVSVGVFLCSSKKTEESTKMWNFKVFFIAIVLSAISVTDILAYVEVYIPLPTSQMDSMIFPLLSPLVDIFSFFFKQIENNRLCVWCVCVCVCVPSVYM